MADQRKKDVDWPVADDAGRMPTWERVGIAVLMDIRDVLHEIRDRLVFTSCPEFLMLPRHVRRIARNTAKPKKKLRLVKRRVT